MTTEQPEALQLADDLDAEAGRITQYTNSRGDLLRELAAAELRRQHAEIETMRAGYSAARLEIESLQARIQELGKAARDVNSRRVQELEAQLAAIGAGGVEPLRKRECLHKISEPARCWCHACRPITVADCRMVLCPYCGNKRCPKANDHRHDCTGSNEPGQQGSAYPSQGITAAQKGGQHGTD